MDSPYNLKKNYDADKKVTTVGIQTDLLYFRKKQKQIFMVKKNVRSLWNIVDKGKLDLGWIWGHGKVIGASIKRTPRR